MKSNLMYFMYKIPKLWCSGGKYARTYAIKYARRRGVKVGENCRLYSPNLSSEEYLIEIGNHVTITSGVEFVTHDGGVWVLRGLEAKYRNVNILGKITIGDNVFVGKNTIFMPGVSIGDNTIVAAGSVVTKSFPPNSVIGGVPAKKIKDIDGYIENNKEFFVDTFQMDYEEKKNFILNNMDNTKFRQR